MKNMCFKENNKMFILLFFASGLVASDVPFLFSPEDKLIDGKTPFSHAIYKSQSEDELISNLEAIISNDAIDQVKARDADDKPPLYWAISKGFLELSRLLITNEAFQSVDLKNQTPLSWVMRNAESEISLISVFQYLVDKDPDFIRGKYIDGKPPLYWAMFRRSEKLSMLLLSNDIDLDFFDPHGMTPLSMTIYSSASFATGLDTVMPMVELLLEKSPDLINRKDKDGKPALYWAYAKEHLSLARFLIDNGSEVDFTDNGSFISLAIRLNDIAMVKDLANRFPLTINQPGFDGIPPISRAMDKKDVDLTRFLIEKGASIDFECYGGESVLSRVVYSRQFEMIELILKFFPEAVNAQDRSGGFPLNWAIKNNDLAATKLLLKKDAHIKSIQYFNLIDQAKDFWLKVIDAHPMIVDLSDQRETLLHKAVDIDDYELAQKLIENKVRINALDIGSKTPLIIALQKGHDNLVKLLMENGADVSYIDSYIDILLSRASRSAQPAIEAMGQAWHRSCQWASIGSTAQDY